MSTVPTTPDPATVPFNTHEELWAAVTASGQADDATLAQAKAAIAGMNPVTKAMFLAGVNAATQDRQNAADAVAILENTFKDLQPFIPLIMAAALVV